MKLEQNRTTAKCNFGDQRLTQRAVLIEEKLSKNYGKGLSSVFGTSGELKRAYEFFANEKTSFRAVSQPYYEKTASRDERTAKLALRSELVKLKSPARLKESEYFEVYAVYVSEIDHPEGCEPINWMLLTTEPVKDAQEAETILRWYTYRWRIEEYHKILKSGCKAESYRLSGDSMQVLLGFLTKIAAQLFFMTYLNRTNPSSPASEVLNEVEIEVLMAKSRKALTQADLTVSWAIGAVASLGGYLSHRRKSNIGITVLWRGLRELHIICEGWLLHKNL